MRLESAGSLFSCRDDCRKDNCDFLSEVTCHLLQIRSLKIISKEIPSNALHIFECVCGSRWFRPWRTRTSSQPLHRASTLNRQSPGPGSPRWTCCCCYCCVPPCGWAATDKEPVGPAWPSCADASAASRAADVPPYTWLRGSLSDVYDHLDTGEKSRKTVRYFSLHSKCFFVFFLIVFSLNSSGGMGGGC